MHTGIQLAKFYYRGVKLIFTRRKDISLIRARIKNGGSPLTRWEYRLIHKQEDDVKKVVPFLIIALLLEEVIPLIAIYAPFMLPSTCILPSQRQRIEAKRNEKAIAFAANYRQLFNQLKTRANPPGHLSLRILHTVDDAPYALCGLLGLPTLGPDLLRIRRIKQRLEFVILDDKLLMQDGWKLSEKFLDEALQERGIMVRGLASRPKESRLGHWLQAVKGTSGDDALTRRLLLLVSRH